MQVAPSSQAICTRPVAAFAGSDRQMSIRVQGSPSSQGLPSANWLSQPSTSEHWSIVQGSLSSQVKLPEHAPSVQESPAVQNRPSSQVPGSLMGVEVEPVRTESPVSAVLEVTETLASSRNPSPLHCGAKPKMKKSKNPPALRHSTRQRTVPLPPAGGRRLQVAPSVPSPAIPSKGTPSGSTKVNSVSRLELTPLFSRWTT